MDIIQKSLASHQKLYGHPLDIIIIIIEIIRKPYINNFHYCRHPMDILQKSICSLQKAYGHLVDIIIIPIELLQKSYRNLLEIKQKSTSSCEIMQKSCRNQHQHDGTSMNIVQTSSSSPQTSYGNPLDIIIIIIDIISKSYRHHSIFLEILWKADRSHHHHYRDAMDRLQNSSSSFLNA